MDSKIEISNADISTILEKIGLGKYAETFIREEIKLDMLPLLTDEHLKQLGINTIGARLKFKSYIRSIHDTELDDTKFPTNGLSNASATSASLSTLTVEVQSLRNAVYSLCDAVRNLSAKSNVK